MSTQKLDLDTLERELDLIPPGVLTEQPSATASDRHTMFRLAEWAWHNGRPLIQRLKRTEATCFNWQSAAIDLSKRLQEAEFKIKIFEIDINEQKGILLDRDKYITELERVREAAQKIINNRRQSAYFSPGDKSQPWLKSQIEESLKELDVALAAMKNET